MTQFSKSTTVSLKNQPEFNEKWVGDRIVEDPSILGLGDLIVRDRERRQAKAGRLDLLLEDQDGEQRYEVELMLGATDESHVIRCIEYWDIERRRYPAYEHCAVLVAEDVTARFLNVLSLIAGSVPLIAIQLTAVEMEGKITLVPIKVLDARQMLREDADSTIMVKSSDRSQWEKSPRTLEVADACLALINQQNGHKFDLSYTQAYIGLLDEAGSHSFVSFWGRKNGASAEVSVEDPEGWGQKIQEAGMTAKVTSYGMVKVTLTPADLDSPAKREAMAQLLGAAVKKYEGS